MLLTVPRMRRTAMCVVIASASARWSPSPSPGAWRGAAWRRAGDCAGRHGVPHIGPTPLSDRTGPAARSGSLETVEGVVAVQGSILGDGTGLVCLGQTPPALPHPQEQPPKIRPSAVLSTGHGGTAAVDATQPSRRLHRHRRRHSAADGNDGSADAEARADRPAKRRLTIAATTVAP